MGKELKACSDYDAATNSCKAGHVQLMPLCRGAQDHGCKNCGHINSIPQCLKEDPPAHLIRDDGLPIGWPHKQESRP